MATAFTTKCSTYIEMKVDYSITATSTGHSVYAEMFFRRTNSYSGSTYNAMTATITIDGQSATIRNGSTFTIPGNNQSWISAGSTTKTVTHTAAKTITIKGSSSAGTYLSGSGSGDVTLPAIITAPTGLSATLNSATWNSMKITGSVTGWGINASSGKIAVYAGSTTGTQPTTSALGAWNRKIAWVVGSSSSTAATPLSAQGTINNSSGNDGTSGITIVGCSPFRIAAYSANNGGVEASRYVPSTTYYTPPYIASVSESSEVVGLDTVNSVITVKGGSGTQHNIENTATTYQLRYTYNSTDSGWINIATNSSPNTTKTYTIVGIPFATNVTVRARMVYQNAYSETKSLTFRTQTDTHPTLPTPIANISSSTGTNLVIDFEIPEIPSEYSGDIVNLKIDFSDGVTTTVRDVHTGDTDTMPFTKARGSSGTVTIYLFSGTTHESLPLELSYQMTSLYGSVNQKSKAIVKNYCSVNRKAKKVLKIYKGKDGKAKRVF